MTVLFELDGQPFTALNGGPCSFNEAISFEIYCDTQAEVDASGTSSERAETEGAAMRLAERQARRVRRSCRKC
jgi:predicted 3-demethylubiquinone-9 3-methyltransferase (glyoxalase superfamily)